MRSQPNVTYISSDPLAQFLDVTMGGGTTLISFPPAKEVRGQSAEDFILVKTAVVVEYERTIAELRAQLLQYKRFITQVTRRADADEQEFGNLAQPLDASSTQLINSVLNANLRSDASFRDFDEGEL